MALAVLTHDLADGVNTVSLTTANGGDGFARRWLLTNAAVPVLGVALGLVATVPPAVMGPLLACFAGAFLYIGACELVPRSHARDPRFRVTLASVGGIALMLLVTRWAE